MSSSRSLIANADSLGLSFLASRTSRALSRILSDSAIGVDEQDALEKAAQFLREISNGAEIAAHGTFREGLSPSKSLAAFDVALGPIDELRKLVAADVDFAHFFQALAVAVDGVAHRNPNPDEEALRGARGFFDVLQKFVSDELASKSYPIGSLSRGLLGVGT